MGAKRRLEPRGALRIRETCLAYIQEQELLPQDARPLLAVSGGRDSMAMLSILHHIGRWPLAVAHCNFTLRGAESDADQALVEEVCDRMGIPVHVRRFDTETWARERACSIQVAARELRYDWFEQLRLQLGCTHVATAHHSGDVAEGLLLNMARGSGLRGMGAIPARNGHVVRPLLGLLPSDLDVWIEEMGVSYRTDASNLSDRYTRNYVRHHVVPALEAVNPQAVSNLLHAAESARVAHGALLEVTERLWGDSVGQGTSFVFPWNQACQDGRQRLAEWWLGECLSARGFNRSQVRNTLVALRDGHTGACVSGGTCDAYVARGELYVVERAEHELLSPGEVRSYGVGERDELLSLRIVDRLPGDFDGCSTHSECSQGRRALLDADALTMPLQLRHWRDGDKLIPLGMRGYKKVSDLLTDAKVIPPCRRRTLVLMSGEHIVWVVGLRIDNRYRVTATTRRVLEVEALPDCPIPKVR